MDKRRRRQLRTQGLHERHPLDAHRNRRLQRLGSHLLLQRPPAASGASLRPDGGRRPRSAHSGAAGGVSTWEDIQTLGKSLEHYADAVNRHATAATTEITKLWDDVAELRDELHALANRVEALTRATGPHAA